jgi:hypothetical protein
MVRGRLFALNFVSNEGSEAMSARETGKNRATTAIFSGELGALSSRQRPFVRARVCQF